MSLKNKFFSFLTIALGVAVFSSFTMAQDAAGSTAAPNAEKRMKGGKHGGKGWGRGHKMGRGGMGMLHAANLTDAQKEQIRVIRESNKPAPGMMEEVKTLRTAKRAGTITAEQQERLNVIKQERAERAKLVHEQIQAILTPEQKALIEQKKAERKQKMQERRQNRQQMAPATTQVG